MNDWKPTQSVVIGDKKFPLYDLNIMRAFMVYTDELPEEMETNYKSNVETIKDRLETNKVVSEEPIAVVGYGPTLKEQWPVIAKFKTIISTSGAHNFLLERDIIPTYHVEVDFRERKAVHTNPSHPDVEYLLASVVHPRTVENVEGKRSKLWHIDITGLTYPEGELVLEGYWDVGQEAILVAKALGYRNLHLFGYDYAYEVGGETHAGFHNGPPTNLVFARIGERYYPTSDSLARGVLTFTKLMQEHPDLSLTIYGSGLLGEYLKVHHSGTV